MITPSNLEAFKRVSVTSLFPLDYFKDHEGGVRQVLVMEPLYSIQIL